MKLKITKKAELEARKEAQEQAQAKRNALKGKAKGWQQLSGKDKDELLREVVEQVLGVDAAERMG